ncbi:NAD(P)/FAD-dependent oxidoreductase [Coleofasciculus chthonoplastes]|uniref:NAD(P)/FAD-dependent oxidoreductase n=1 Tax=Coleofasciculus chthonoplastes TaxID=64178 RepID=UPI0032F3D7D8
MTHVAIIGCGIVGAAIAYQLSGVSGLQVTVLDRHPPAQGSTGAALGVLMGVISQKVKGRTWQLRQASMQRYETLIPELETLTGYQIPFNRQGILMLAFENDDLARWQNLVKIRQSQGWQLEIWNTAQVESHCPQLNLENSIGAIYSPNDRQVEPTALTHALVAAAQQRGVTFKFGVGVEGVESMPVNGSNQRICQQIYTQMETLAVDWLVIAAGLGSAQLVNFLLSPPNQSSAIALKPVLGQALQLRLGNTIGHPDFQPVITADDVHIVPIGGGDYWVGATVEFPHGTEVVAEPALLEQVKQDAIGFCPALAQATVVRTWLGKRPRPEGQPAPVIGKLSGYDNVLLATGHYRNGVLLAPATAQEIQAIICAA